MTLGDGRRGRVMILGGTGAIGRSTVAACVDAGFDVVVTSRRTGLSDAGPHVTLLHGDAHDDAFLQAIVDEYGGFDAVVDFMHYTTARFAERMPLLLGLSDQYVFLSSVRVYADSPTPIREESPRLLDVSEDQRYLATDEYGLAKARQEDLLAGFGHSGWTVVRPSITYAEGRLQLGVLEADTWLWRATRGLPVGVPDTVIDRMTTMTAGSDSGVLIAGLLGNPRALGERFTIATDESLTWRDVAEVYAAEVGLDLRVVDNARYTRFAGQSAQLRYDRMYDRRFDVTKVLDAVGGHQFIDTRTALAAAVGTTNAGAVTPNVRMNGVMDKLTGARCGLGQGLGRSAVSYRLARHPHVARTVNAVKKLVR